MSKKKAFALRLDESLLKSIEKWAADEFRSTNGQLKWMIRESLKKAGMGNIGQGAEEKQAA